MGQYLHFLAVHFSITLLHAEQSLHEIKEMDENFDLYPSDYSFCIRSAVRHNPILILLMKNSKILIISKVGFTVVIFSNTV